MGAGGRVGKRTQVSRIEPSSNHGTPASSEEEGARESWIPACTHFPCTGEGVSAGQVLGVLLSGGWSQRSWDAGSPVSHTYQEPAPRGAGIGAANDNGAAVEPLDHADKVLALGLYGEPPPPQQQGRAGWHQWSSGHVCPLPTSHGVVHARHCPDGHGVMVEPGMGPRRLSAALTPQWLRGMGTGGDSHCCVTPAPSLAKGKWGFTWGC